jgi:hypothetical protein
MTSGTPMSGVIDGRGVPEVPRDANDVEPDLL